MIRWVFKFFSRQKKVNAPPRTPDGVRIYTIGDIHGRLDLLEELQAKIVTDARSGEHLKIIQIFLGDYVDRGSDSKGVVDFLIQPAPPGWERICLKGNHEIMLSRFLDDHKVLIRWAGNGGQETMKSYDVGCTRRTIKEKPKKLLKKFKKILPDAHRIFFSQLMLCVEFGDYFFVHAGVRPGVALDAQVEEDLTWIRKEFINSKKDFGKVIVHGHTPQEMPEVRFNRINIDTGAWISGRLTCLVLEGEDQRFL